MTAIDAISMKDMSGGLILDAGVSAVVPQRLALESRCNISADQGMRHKWWSDLILVIQNLTALAVKDTDCIRNIPTSSGCILTFYPEEGQRKSPKIVVVNESACQT